MDRFAGTDDTTRNYYDMMGRALGSIGPDPDGAGREETPRGAYYL